MTSIDVVFFCDSNDILYSFVVKVVASKSFRTKNFLYILSSPQQMTAPPGVGAAGAGHCGVVLVESRVALSSD